MRFARWVFLVSAIYGIVILTLGMLLERLQAPPPITHPEFYYGFYGSALAWQLGFLLIASDPIRFRPLMLAAIAEKLAFTVVCFALLALGRLQPSGPLYGSVIDAGLMTLFIAAYLRTPARKPA